MRLLSWSAVLLHYHTRMAVESLQKLIDPVPPGRWAVGVSGGADSVALLLLLKDRPDLSLHIAHLDHQTRRGESGEDAAFVAKLAAKLKLPCTIALRSDVESSMSDFPKNISSRYRAARLHFFHRVVAAENLRGVLLAHHADDQAETTLLRMLRGASPYGLGGIRHTSRVRGVQMIRPLLAVRSSQLRVFLENRNQPWREDSSNASEDYRRNRIRRWLNIGRVCVIDCAIWKPRAERCGAGSKKRRRSWRLILKVSFSPVCQARWRCIPRRAG